jgi:hypothetical protein
MRTAFAVFSGMADRSSSGAVIHSWSWGARAWQDEPVARGSLRISGTVLDGGASWYVTTDRLGWSTVALISDVEGADGWDALGTLRRCADGARDPVHTALAIRDRLRVVSRERCRNTGLAVARFGPDGRLLELVNVSMPTVLHWDPVEGLSPYEPLFPSLDAMTEDANSEMLRLKPGSALVLATQGVLPHDASWSALRGFVRAVGIDAFGGTVADAPPSELERVLRSSWGFDPEAPTGMVLAGLPSIEQQVA